jgi:hypothetical protein
MIWAHHVVDYTRGFHRDPQRFDLPIAPLDQDGLAITGG